MTVDRIRVMVVLEGCGELIVTEVSEAESGDPDKMRLVVDAIRPGA
jgi:hypothetical protein